MRLENELFEKGQQMHETKSVDLDEPRIKFIRRQKLICDEFRHAMEDLDIVMKPKYLKIYNLDDREDADFEDYIDNRNATRILIDQIKRLQREIGSIKNLLSIVAPEQSEKTKRIMKKLSKLDTIFISLLNRAMSLRNEC